MNGSQRNQMLCWVLCSFLLGGFAARANVYATDIQLNGSLMAGVVVPGGNTLTINYILNDNATAGVSVRIYSGANVVKTFTSDSAEAGTNAGLNTVVWDGLLDNGSNAAAGVYTVSITAGSLGYGDVWTNITDDGTNFQVAQPSGIAVNKNTNSPYYGRVFVGNIGDPNVGIFKYNADGSPADEGGFSTGNYSWNPNGYGDPSPWKMDISPDDRLYVDDWSGNGVVLSFDQVLSADYLPVLRPDNYPSDTALLSGPCVRGTGTNTQLFMADANKLDIGETGIIRWTLGPDGTIAPNDTGTIVVPSGGESALTWAPYAVALDTNWNIYAIQQVTTNNPLDPLLCFPPFTNNAADFDTNAVWDVPLDLTLINANGVAVDPTGTYVAVACRGYGNNPEKLEGALDVFQAANGAPVASFITDLDGDTNQEFIDVAWDNAGNLYALAWNTTSSGPIDSIGEELWRVYSPPGSNQMTTVAVPVIQVLHELDPPQLLAPAAGDTQLTFTLAGQSNVTYIIDQSPDLTNWTPVATNYSPQPNRLVAIPFADAQDFYRARTSP
jgi:hypothetical protein